MDSQGLWSIAGVETLLDILYIAHHLVIFSLLVGIPELVSSFSRLCLCSHPFAQGVAHTWRLSNERDWETGEQTHSCGSADD